MMENRYIVNAFENKYLKSHQYYTFSPGRANIIGEHTDYNGGYVFPFAIKQGLTMIAATNDLGILRIWAIDLDETGILHLDGTAEDAKPWTRFFLQVMRWSAFDMMGGLDIAFGGDLPIGGGISSSSALTCAFINTLRQAYLLDLSPDEMVNLASLAETGTGVRGGIMDQYTIIYGIKDHAILLDCLDQSSQFVRLELNDYHFYLINTNVKHNLIDTDYNNRRAQCERALQLLSATYKSIDSLRELTQDDLTMIRPILDDVLYKRVSYIVRENQRVLDAVFAVKGKDYVKLGKLLIESHEGLANDYQVSCDELDWIVSKCNGFPSIVGARMMGGGFGGCVIALVKGHIHAETQDKWSKMYEDTFGLTLDFLPIEAGDGILSAWSETDLTNVGEKF